MTTKLFVLWDRMRSSYWFVPSVMAVVSVSASFLCGWLDEYFRDELLQRFGWIYTGGAEGARAVLSTIAGSIITVAGTTFSITIAALSLASAQYGPRLLRSFMRDTGNQVVLGTFVATFLYCLMVLRTVRGLDNNTYVPHISVTVGVALAVLSLGVLIYFIHHVAESIQASHIVSVVGGELNDTVKRLFPERLGTPPHGSMAPVPPAETPICAERDGYVQQVDEHALMREAVEQDLVIIVEIRPGLYVHRGAVLARLTKDAGEKSKKQVRRAFTLGNIRTPRQDAEFALLQVAEIAVRSLSPGINDPFTAMMCLDRISTGMILLAQRSLPEAERHDKNGKLRIFATPYGYGKLTEAAYRHIREAARDHWQVFRLMREQIRIVLDHTEHPDFRAALIQELAHLE